MVDPGGSMASRSENFPIRPIWPMLCPIGPSESKLIFTHGLLGSVVLGGYDVHGLLGHDRGGHTIAGHLRFGEVDQTLLLARSRHAGHAARDVDVHGDGLLLVHRTGGLGHQ
ncbi:hypothetical protein FHX42_002412 [Saccharopolyspora lacisalsi]|uniref:Uncharacterized protein n=1 Tax=Halosaccharopolyspora lacisalsi TaxID=1000566 RepID=A0A839E0U9_9PSEU|nr:hypothetical protein [Halosaccharopolyspora lacisalsi]MBA8825061.1 hypothetical protein [Halosaccharopolyspora lacisalsi]